MASPLSVFTKPWPELPVAELAQRMRALGVQGIELPVRPGFQVSPETALRDLPGAVRILADQGLGVFSIAAEPVPGVIEACALAGVPLIRVMAAVAPGERYTGAEARLRAAYTAMEPDLRAHGVRVGVQNHCGSYVPNALGLRALLEGLDPACFCAVWDAAHEALVGTLPEFALDTIWPRLGMVNLKNGYWEREGAGTAHATPWRVRWCAGREGLADWPRVVAALEGRGYDGVVCLTAEYSEPGSADRLIAEDTDLARSLFAFAAAGDAVMGGGAHGTAL